MRPFFAELWGINYRHVMGHATFGLHPDPPSGAAKCSMVIKLRSDAKTILGYVKMFLSKNLEKKSWKTEKLLFLVF